MEQKYSVLMSVYIKEDPSYLQMSIDSLLAQTLPPDEILLIEDGPLSDGLNAVIDAAKRNYPDIFTIHKLSENSGLGEALRIGVPLCRNSIIARMDSDDYAYPDRIEKQLHLMSDHKLDLVGSQVSEFIDSPDDPITHSSLPTSYKDIVSYSHKRNPFRHPTVIFTKDAVLKAGNYRKEYLFFEDWDLFNRMLQSGAKAENYNEELVAMRVSPDFFNRRGGISYLPYIWKFKTAQYRNHYFSLTDFCISTIPHVMTCLVPNKVRSFIYTHLLRKG